MRESDKEERRRGGSKTSVFHLERGEPKVGSALDVRLSPLGSKHSATQISQMPPKPVKRFFLEAFERRGNLAASGSGHFQAESPDCVQRWTAGGRGASPKQGHIISVSQPAWLHNTVLLGREPN